MLHNMKRLVWVLAVVGAVAAAPSCGALPDAGANSAGSIPVSSSVESAQTATTAAIPTTEPASVGSSGAAATTAEVTQTSAAAVNGARYETVTSVLESADHGPELCLGGMLDSSPPQCGGVPITNWDWNAIEGEQTVQSTTWVDSVDVTGAYDRSAFTLESVRPATPEDQARFTAPPPDFHAPCPEPPGGWLAAKAGADPSTPLSGDHPIARYVESQPDAGGWWGDGTIDPNWPNSVNDPRKVIVVASFTGDLARHEADLRALWSGALCVTQAKYSARELHDLAVKVTADIQNDGTLPLPDGTVLHVLTFNDSGNFITGTVDLEVMVAYPQAQQWYDDTYGAGRVVLTGQMRPVA